MEDRVEKILDSLSKSKFRSSFHLKEIDMQYIKEKGLTKIKIHAYDFVNKRLKNTKNVNDGKQTPTKGHPVFIAQHATATCWRGCLEKWHKISKDKALSVVASLSGWLRWANSYNLRMFLELESLKKELGGNS